MSAVQSLDRWFRLGPARLVPSRGPACGNASRRSSATTTRRRLSAPESAIAVVPATVLRASATLKSREGVRDPPARALLLPSPTCSTSSRPQRKLSG
ncbi:hypothetical protein RRG08_049566 [Elysia crispata]|uniref:Uncharacterized protein n=1 Tax=Elysia crispata TaxID=231223 RepID=A0AAE0Z689_9GAST|nr:hypothetical protein RRG08_049566 [Elysia crispata]